MARTRGGAFAAISLLTLALTGCGRLFPAPIERPKVGVIPPPATFIRVASWTRSDWNPTCVFLSHSGVLLVAEDSARVQYYTSLGYRGQAQPFNDIYSFGGLTRPVQIAEGAGHIFIADMGDGTAAHPMAVFEYDPVGALPFAPIKTIRDTSWVRIRGLAADEARTVYVSCDARVLVPQTPNPAVIDVQSLIYHYHANGLRDTTAEQGTGIGTVQGAGALAYKDGAIYAADTEKDWGQKIDAAGKNLGYFKVDGTEDGAPGPLKGPVGVAVDDSNYFYISDTGHGRVLRYYVDGTFNQVVNQNDTLNVAGANNLAHPGSVTVGLVSGRLYAYVADPFLHIINLYKFQR